MSDVALSRGNWLDALRIGRPNVNLCVGAAIVIGWALVALLAPWIAPHDPIAHNLPEKLQAPTLLWLWSDDAALHLLCAVGALCAVAVVAGVATFWTLGILWATYLSLAVGGQTFLQFQWDSLLLEATLCALLLVPFAWRPGAPAAAAGPDPRLGIWVLRALRRA